MGIGSSKSTMSMYNKSTNTINISATNEMVNSAMMSSIKNAMSTAQTNCSSQFSSDTKLQISNLVALDTMVISDINVDSKNIVRLECINQQQLQSQAEDNFFNDNSSKMQTMLASMASTDFISGINGTLKNKIDSAPLTASLSATETNITNDIKTEVAVNILQNIKNLYESTSVTNSTQEAVSKAYTSFVSTATLELKDITLLKGGVIKGLNLTSVNQFDSYAKLAQAISQVFIQKMQSILGMQISFDSSTSQTSTGGTNTSQDSSSEVTNNTALNQAAGVANNAVNQAAGVANNTVNQTAGVVNSAVNTVATVNVGMIAGIVVGVVVFLIVVAIIIIVIVRKGKTTTSLNTSVSDVSLNSSSTSSNTSLLNKEGSGFDNFVDKMLHYGNKYIQEETLYTLKHT